MNWLNSKDARKIQMHTEQTLSQGGFQAVPVDKLQPGLRVISLMRLWIKSLNTFSSAHGSFPPIGQNSPVRAFLPDSPVHYGNSVFSSREAAFK